MKHHTDLEVFTAIEKNLKECMKKFDGTEQERAIYASEVLGKYYEKFKCQLFMQILEDLEIIYVFEPYRTDEIYRKYGVY